MTEAKGRKGWGLLPPHGLCLSYMNRCHAANALPTNHDTFDGVLQRGSDERIPTRCQMKRMEQPRKAQEGVGGTRGRLEGGHLHGLH